MFLLQTSFTFGRSKSCSDKEISVLTESRSFASCGIYALFTGYNIAESVLSSPAASNSLLCAVAFPGCIYKK